MTVIAFSHAIGPVSLDCFLREKHVSEIGITENPIETGAEVNDHAFLMPKQITLEIADSNAASTYNALMRFQETRIPFVLVTGLSVYPNMLIKTLEAERDELHSRILKGRADLQEIIIVDTAYAVSEAGSEAPDAGNAGGTNSARSARPASSRSGDAVTADRSAGTVQRGDSPVKTALVDAATAIGSRNLAILQRVFND